MSNLAVPLPRDAAAGIYVHIPFCRYICPYCDFNVYAGQESLIPAYIDAVIEEIARWAEAVPAVSATSTLFIGGGTPSLVPAGHLARVVDAAAEHLGLQADAEITLEANPEGVSEEYARELLEIGINRLSIGVQSLQQPGLKVLGRIHGAAGAEAAFQNARSARHANISLDFIYGWPGQSIAEWEQDLRLVMGWEPDHLSLYSLIVESGTPMALAVKRGQLRPVDDDDVADEFELAVDLLAANDWRHYEISNWCRSDEQRSRHNQLYWQNGSYYGIGAGAHGYIAGERYSNVRLPSAYIDQVRSGALPVHQRERISAATELGETMMLGLRLLADGVSNQDIVVRHGVSLNDAYGPIIGRFLGMHLLEWHGDRLRLTERGAFVANAVCAEFLPDSEDVS